MPKPGRDADDLAKTEADHFMVCPGCGRVFDMRDLKQVAEHIHNGDFEIKEAERKGQNPAENGVRCRFRPAS